VSDTFRYESGEIPHHLSDGPFLLEPEKVVPMFIPMHLVEDKAP